MCRPGRLSRVRPARCAPPGQVAYVLPTPGATPTHCPVGKPIRARLTRKEFDRCIADPGYGQRRVDSEESAVSEHVNRSEKRIASLGAQEAATCVSELHAALSSHDDTAQSAR